MPTPSDSGRAGRLRISKLRRFPPTRTGSISTPVTQSIGQTVSQANTTAPIPATTVGNLVVAFYARSGGLATGALTSVTDSAGGSWTLATRGAVSGGSNTRIECWYRENCPSITSVTFNSGTAQTNSWDITEWSGMLTSGSLDVASPDNSATASSMTVTTPTVAPTQITDLVLAAFHCGQTTTSGLTAQFAELAQFDDAAVGTGRAAWLVDKGVGPYSASWTLGAAKACGVITVAFKVVGGVNAPAAPPPQSTPPRRARWFIRGGGYATQPVPPQVVVTVTPRPPDTRPVRARWLPRPGGFTAFPVPAPVVVTVVPPPPEVRAPRRRWLPKPRPKVASPPWTVSVTVPPQPVRGRLAPPRRRRVFTAAPVTVQVLLPPQPVRDRLQPPRPRRSRSTQPVPPQVVVVTAQALPPQPGRPVRAPWLPRSRAHRAEPVWPQQVVVLHPAPPQQGRATRPYWLPRARARQAQPPPTVTVYVQQPTRDRLLPPMLRRQRSAAPVPAQVVVQTVQALPPQPARPNRPAWLPRAKARHAEPVWPQVVVTPHPVPPQPPRVKRPWWLPRSRAKKYEPGWPQGVGPSFTVGVLSSRTDRTGGPD